MDQHNKGDGDENGAWQGRRHDGTSGDRDDVPSLAVSGVHAGVGEVVSRISAWRIERELKGIGLKKQPNDTKKRREEHMPDNLKEKLKQLSNPFSTGGGGNNFERHVQAFFLLALLADGVSPALDYPITELLFQAKIYGYHTDDLVALVSYPGGTGKILCQIKNNITATKSDTVFQEVLTAAWNDFKSDKFNKEIDKIALITNVVAKSSMNALRKIHEQAAFSGNVEDFLRRIEQSNFVSNETRTKYEVLKYCLSRAKGSELSATELYEFCRVFLLIVFDGNYDGSIHEALCKSLIRCKSNEEPRRAWDALTEYAGRCSQNAARITRNNVGLEIRELFGYKLQDTDADSFVPTEAWAQFVLIGAWNENCKADRLAIEAITGIRFSVFLGLAREQLNAGTPYLSLSNGFWRVSLRSDLFPRVKDLFYDDIIKRAFQAASKFVVEISRQFTDADTFGFIKPADGWFSNSDVFRKSLCEGLCFLANGAPPKFASNNMIAHEAVHLVHNLFQMSSWQTLAGLGELLPIIAELSPTAYIQELESFSVQRIQELKKLFPTKHRQSVLDGNPMTQILWSLETLAWVPDYFGACVRCLGTIELAGYEKTNYANTPINSIISILNAFHPQTFASIEQRKHAILALQKDSPELCWTVIQALLPESSFVLTDAPKPKFISLLPFEREVPQSETSEMFQYYIDTAIHLSSESAERLAELSTHVGYMSGSMISDYLNQIILAAQNWTDEVRYPVWDSLCELRVRVIRENEHTKTDSKLFSQLEQAISATKPEGKWHQYLHLYTRKLDEYYLDNSFHSWEKREADRTKAVFDLYDSFGIDSVISFGNRVNDLHDVGWKLGEILNSAQIIDILDRYFKDASSSFFSAVISGFIKSNSVEVLNTMELEKYDTSFRAKVLFAAPFAPETFSIIQDYLPNKTLYWKEVPVTWFSPEWSQQTLEYVIQELIESRRFVVIINSLGHLVKKYDLADRLLETILLGAISEQAPNQIDAYAACSIIDKLQKAELPNIDALVEIEYAYLPFLVEPSTTHPKALYYKLSNDDAFFCELMELMYNLKSV